MKLILLMNVKLLINLTLTLQTIGAILQVKFQILQLSSILYKQTRFLHGNKTTLDEKIFVSLKALFY